MGDSGFPSHPIGSEHMEAITRPVSGTPSGLVLFMVPERLPILDLYFFPEVMEVENQFPEIPGAWLDAPHILPSLGF